jgi:hypothetical protein
VAKLHALVAGRDLVRGRPASTSSDPVIPQEAPPR